MAEPRLTATEDAAWRGFLRTHELIWVELERRLDLLGVSMAEYSALALLAESGPSGMSMSELAEQRLMSSSGFSRLADRLERRGLIERRRSARDGRSFDATLTSAGRALLKKAWRHHHADLRELFFDRLTDADLERLAEIWRRLQSAGREQDSGSSAPAPTGKPSAAR
jgi:DNA-binding MarR family transcriptional regulator